MLTVFFFFNDTATTEIYTLSLHDALPICPDDKSHLAGTGELVHRDVNPVVRIRRQAGVAFGRNDAHDLPDRKSTRLNSSHANISYAVFCLKKKKTTKTPQTPNNM